MEDPSSSWAYIPGEGAVFVCLFCSVTQQFVLILSPHNCFQLTLGGMGAWWRQQREGKGLYCSLTPKREGRGREGLVPLCWEAWVTWGGGCPHPASAMPCPAGRHALSLSPAWQKPAL